MSSLFSNVIEINGNVCFLSDAHFGTPNQQDSERREDMLVSLLNQVGDKTQHLFLLGDMFDFWFEYLRQEAPGKQEMADAWSAAIGLQAVDGLVTSKYLQATARRNIEGEITIDEAHKLITSYYQSKQSRMDSNNDNEEADKVAINITKILTSDTMAFNANGFISPRRRIFYE